MKSDLAKFFQKKQAKAKTITRIDWDERREKYLAAVEDLYSQIKAALAEPIEQKTVKIQRRSKPITETYIGNYAIDDLILLTGDEQVRFSPRGRNVVRAEGRVDVVGERGEITMILQDDARWYVVRTRQPKLQVEPLNPSTLAAVLQQVMRT